MTELLSLNIADGCVTEKLIQFAHPIERSQKQRVQGQTTGPRTPSSAHLETATPANGVQLRQPLWLHRPLSVAELSSNQISPLFPSLN
jgi:hypothetical protein